MKVICLPMLAIAVTASIYAANCSSVDIPISFTISSTYTDPSSSISYSADIISDGGGAYINGQQGVTALIHVCNGSNGATLVTRNGSRYVTWNFQNAVDTNALTPSWTNSPMNNFTFTVANLLYSYNPSSTYSFTTYLDLANFNLSTGAYYFNMQNPSANAPFNAPGANVNSPCDTSLVNATHIPATSTSKETWIVWPSDSPVFCSSTVTGQHAQVGTLTTTGHPNPVSVGQFTLSFFITIQRL